MNTKFTNEFSKEIFDTNYSVNNETVDEMHDRIASYLAQNETDKEFYTKKFKEILKDFCFVPGGRIMSNAGRTNTETTMINCFVSGFRGYDQDSMPSIAEELKRQMLILKSEGGYGFNIDVLRPKGTYISGIANESPGAVTMLDMWDTSARVITAGSGKFSDKKDSKKKIRKGAQMVTLSCFSENTEILTNFGWMNVVEIINKVKNNENIYAIDEYSNENLIINPIVKEPEPIYKIETEDGDIIEVTADHKFEMKNIKTDEIYLKAIKDINPDIEIFKMIML